MTRNADYAVEAAQDGRHAGHSGSGENPHPWGTLEHAAWDEGWAGEQDSAAQRWSNRVKAGAA